MIISISAEKASGQIPQPFMIKTFGKPGLEGNFPNLDIAWPHTEEALRHQTDGTCRAASARQQQQAAHCLYFIVH